MSVKITIIGGGYVGMSLAVAMAMAAPRLGQSYRVVVLDIDVARVASIEKGISPIKDADIEAALAKGGLDISATTDAAEAYAQAAFIIVATPTDYDGGRGQFDTQAVDAVVADALAHNEDASIIIKSTIPVGHSRALREKHKTERIIFSPEFLREGQALHDNLHPARIIIGAKNKAAEDFAAVLQNIAVSPAVETLFMDSDEAEAVKLFANTYLAMRVSFFNELDSYAMARGLDAGAIIKGVSLDSRIGDYYNNPSFGYGGYCLPKDSQQLLTNYEAIPQDLIGAIVASNETRKDFIAAQILKSGAGVIGIYRLAMKSGSDNARTAAILGVIEKLQSHDVRILIYEPSATPIKGCEMIDDLTAFKTQAEIIIANRRHTDLDDVQDKLFTRDIFGEN